MGGAEPTQNGPARSERNHRHADFLLRFTAPSRRRSTPHRPLVIEMRGQAPSSTLEPVPITTVGCGLRCTTSGCVFLPSLSATYLKYASLARAAKPQPEAAPSNRGVVGRYVLTSEIFHHLAQTGRGAGGEIQLTDGIARLLERDRVLAYAFEGKRYDCGSKIGYLQATVEYALKHHHLGDEFTDWIRQRFGLN